MAGITPEILQLVGSQSSNTMNQLQQYSNSAASYFMQKRLNDAAYAHDVDMWNRANEYNSPASQMQRLKAAGLNPNLAYGSGSVAGNTTSQLPKYQAISAPEMPSRKGRLIFLISFRGFRTIRLNKRKLIILLNKMLR